MALTTEGHALLMRGPLVDVEFRHHPDVDLSETAKLWGEVPVVKASLLVDTGARHSAIDRRIVDDLKIKPISNLGEVITAAGQLRERPIYMVEMRMTFDGITVSLPTAVIGLEPGPLLTKSSYQGILGRSWLQKTRFMYDGVAGRFKIEVVKK